MPTVYIRVDGDAKIGMGHLVRCIALGRMLKSYFQCYFVYRYIPVQIKSEIILDDFGIVKIIEETSFFNKISRSDIVVLDGYQFDINYQKTIKEKGAKLVCIDDLHDKPFLADLIINHSPGIQPQDYKTSISTQFALGPSYALLRQEFLRSTKIKAQAKKIEEVFVCFGGADRDNYTKKILEVLIPFTDVKKIVVVTGPGYDHLKNLQILISKHQKIEHYQSIDSVQMAELMKQIDLAIVPASGILLECLSIGCKVISGYYVNNQKFIYNNYKEAGAFLDAKNFTPEDLKKALQQAFKGDETVNKFPIDGKSGQRLLKYFLQLTMIDKIKLRKCNLSDLKVTYKWISNRNLRKFSFNQHEIKEEEHSLWFNSKLGDRTCFYYIADLQSEPIGSIRFELNGTEAVISYQIDPKYHGKGFGQLLLINGLSQLLCDVTDHCIKKVVGYVISSNIPSVKSFERLGYLKIKERDTFKFVKHI